eukprot:4549560-Karenia_brevis.AAC.1
MLCPCRESLSAEKPCHSSCIAMMIFPLTGMLPPLPGHSVIDHEGAGALVHLEQVLFTFPPLQEVA